MWPLRAYLHLQVPSGKWQVYIKYNKYSPQFMQHQNGLHKYTIAHNAGSSSESYGSFMPYYKHNQQFFFFSGVKENT